jgi:hypothetical protein
VILLKTTGAITKEFLKAVSPHINAFSEAGEKFIKKSAKKVN